MYEQYIAQLIIQRVRELIISAFAQLDGGDGDEFNEIYLTIENNKKDIGHISGLAPEIIDRITALIGEKVAANIGSALLYETNKETDVSKTKNKVQERYSNKREAAQKILRKQLVSIIANKIGQKNQNESKVTLVELKLAKIISSSLLKQILKNKNITMQTTIDLDKVQSMVKTSVKGLLQLISNNGKVPDQAIKISHQTNIIENLSSELNIMNPRGHKGIGSELISSPDATPHVDKDTSRSR